MLCIPRGLLPLLYRLENFVGLDIGGATNKHFYDF